MITADKITSFVCKRQKTICQMSMSMNTNRPHKIVPRLISESHQNVSLRLFKYKKKLFRFKVAEFTSAVKFRLSGSNVCLFSACQFFFRAVCHIGVVSCIISRRDRRNSLRRHDTRVFQSVFYVTTL